ncbi:MAG: peptidoglycan synthetase [Flavobacteriales bacterium]|nr:peptidoglycan synthetase [Flavobacteriales bacterium]
MKVHFIAIGGSAMHNLALALHSMGNEVTGSDDQIFEPSRTRLEVAGLLPEKMGWDPTRINKDVDAVILGMHARPDNPELLKAQEMGMNIYSYPEYIAHVAANKKRVVIGGSHGKTTITSMILHVLKSVNMDCDYLVGAQLEGFDRMVKLSDAPLIVIEGDEYLSSPIDRRPKFHWYKPHIALVSGIAWDHINVFPTFENYLDQFLQFIALIEKDGVLIYNNEDEHLRALVDGMTNDIRLEPYGCPDHDIRDGKTFLRTLHGSVELQVFGRHNLHNINGAYHVCSELGVSDPDFFKAIATFRGAAKRLELIASSDNATVYKDFAHAPSKLKAAVSAVGEQYPDRELVAVMELHTFSSLNKDFLKQYTGTMNPADRAFVYYNPETLAHKKLETISPDQVKEAFGRPDLEVYTSSGDLLKTLRNISWKGKNLLLMTSGNFDGVDLNAFGKEVLAD